MIFLFICKMLYVKGEHRLLEYPKKSYQYAKVTGVQFESKYRFQYLSFLVRIFKNSQEEL